jgi:hypothetical protein
MIEKLKKSGQRIEFTLLPCGLIEVIHYYRKSGKILDKFCILKKQVKEFADDYRKIGFEQGIRRKSPGFQ